MEKFAPVLLEVWREACRHIDIAESVARMAPLLVRHLPAELVMVRRIDVAHRCVETVAAGLVRPSAEALAARTECPAEHVERLLSWCRSERTIWADAEEVRLRLPGLLPAGLAGHVLAASLEAETEPVGVLVLVAAPSERFGPEHEPMVQALREPFALALENDRRLRELTKLREAAEADRRSLLSRLGRQDISDAVVGAETGLQSVMERVELVAHADAPVLILGETGSGKEVVARAIHARSRRAEGPFLRVNCGAIPPELIDSELFGHERGSFTGAVEMRKGWFERADGGTLFLDEMAELPLAAQVRLLRILQDGTFERVGAQRTQHVDVRVVAATNRDLRAMVSEGLFREDLWYRVAVFIIRIPPLRERVQDVPALAAHFALRAAKRLGTPPLVPTPQDNDLLVSYSWPGNARELSAVIERAAILGNGQRLEVAKALGLAGESAPRREPAEAVSSAPAREPPDRFPTLDEAMTRHIEQALTRTHGRVEGPNGAARLLAINPHTLRARMRKLGIQWQRFRAI